MLKDKVEEFMALSEEYNLDVLVLIQIYLGLTQEISLEAYRENGDYTDEHMAGLVDVFREQTDKLFELLESVVSKQD